MTYQDLINFLQDDSTYTMKATQGSEIYTICKADFDENTILLYANYTNGMRKSINRQMEYQGFYSRIKKVVFGMRHYLKEAVKGTYEPQCSMEDLQREIHDKLSEKISVAAKQIAYDITELKERHKENYEYFLNVEAKEMAKNYFCRNENVDSIQFKPYINIDTITDLSAIEYVHNPSFIENYVECYLKEQDYSIKWHLWETDCLRKELKILEGDIGSELHIQRKISQAITDEKTVKVTVEIDGKQFTFSSEANTIKRHYYGTWYIAARDRKEYKTLFGNYDYKAKDIVKITHGRKVLYSRN